MKANFAPAVDQHASCPHMAILLDSPDEVAPSLASFYALGLRRNGWLFHRALPGAGDADRRAFADAGFDIAPLEEQGRFQVSEIPITDPPETWAEPLMPMIDQRLGEGYDAIWWSRFPVGTENEDVFKLALEYDHHWDIAIAGRKAVSLCVYVVGDLPAAQREQQLNELSAVHDATLELKPDGELAVRARTASTSAK